MITFGYGLHGKGITVSVSPDVKTKSINELDLPIVLDIIAAEGQIPDPSIKLTVFSNKLSHDGTIKLVVTTDLNLPADLAKSSVTSPVASPIANPEYIEDSISIEEQAQIKFIFDYSKNSTTLLSNLMGLVKKPKTNFHFMNTNTRTVRKQYQI